MSEAETAGHLELITGQIGLKQYEMQPDILLRTINDEDYNDGPPAGKTSWVKRLVGPGRGKKNT